MRLLLVLFTALLAWGQEPPAAKISGKVVDSVTLAPLRKATVMLFGSVGNRPLSLRTNSDAEGNFSFDNLSEGFYNLRGEKTAYLNTIYGARSSGAGGSPIRLSKGDKRQDLQLKLIPQAAISGRVLDEDGDPLDRVELTLLRRISQDGQLRLAPAAGGQSNDRGEFRLAGIAPGKYLLSLQRTGGLDSIPAQGESTGTAYLPVYFPGVESASEAQSIQLAAGQELASLSLSLRRTKVFRVRGRFVDRSGDPPAKSRYVQANQKGGGVLNSGFGGFQRTIVSSKDNSFELSGLAPGSYTIYILENAANGNRPSGKLDITIGNSNLDGVEVPALSMSALSGTIRVEGNGTAIDPKNLAIGLVPFETGSNNPIPVQHREGGRFEAAGLAPEKYRLVPELKNQKLYVKSILAGGKAVSDGMLDLSAGASMDIELILSTKVGHIDGMVEKESADLSFGAVLLLPVNGGRHTRARLDPSGKFSAPNLGPGEYLIYALEGDGPTLLDPDVLPKLASKALKVELSEGETKSVTLKQITWEEIEKAGN
jgi:hypothetical protein